MRKALRTRITGRVQGVGYRAWLEETARAHGVDGWVRNRHDGSVEAVISGEDGIVELVLQLLGQGPPAARVERVESAPTATPPELGFRMLPTA